MRRVTVNEVEAVLIRDHKRPADERAEKRVFDHRRGADLKQFPTDVHQRTQLLLSFLLLAFSKSKK